MKSIDRHGTFEDVIVESEPHAQALARRVRELIAGVYPEVVEVPWPKQQVVGYGIGPKKMSEHFAYIGAFRNHVNLGFNYGAELPDPDRLLEGTGKKFRHVKIEAPGQVEQDGVRALIEAAIVEREQSLGRKR